MGDDGSEHVQVEGLESVHVGLGKSVVRLAYS